MPRLPDHHFTSMAEIAASEPGCYLFIACALVLTIWMIFSHYQQKKEQLAQLSFRLNKLLESYEQKFGAQKQGKQFIANYSRFALSKVQRPHVPRGASIRTGSVKAMAVVASIRLVGNWFSKWNTKRIDSAVLGEAGKTDEQLRLERYIVDASVSFLKLDAGPESYLCLIFAMALAFGFIFWFTNDYFSNAQHSHDRGTESVTKFGQTLHPNKPNQPSEGPTRDSMTTIGGILKKGNSSMPPPTLPTSPSDSPQSPVSDEAILSSEPDFIAIDSIDGKRILAKVLALTKTTVLVRRNDGKDFDVPLSRLTEQSKQRIDENRKARMLK